jgi:hypothetical protein
MKFRVLGLVGLLLGCQATGRETLRDSKLGIDELKAPEDALAVSLRVMVATTDGGERLLGEDESLGNLDPFSLVVRASQPAYLYVVHSAQDGSVQVLFPTATHQRVPASCPVRLPQRRSLYVQGTFGKDDLNVVASLRPLAEVDSRLCEDLRLPCRAGEPATPPQTAPCSPLVLPKLLPPPAAAVSRRAIFPNVTVGRDKGQGVASLHFSIRHVR